MTLGVYLKRALDDFRLRFGTQVMTTMVVCLSILILSFFSMLYINLEHFVERFGSELGIVVFLKKDVPQDQVPKIYERLSRVEGLQSINYVSPEEAYKRLERYLGKEREVLEGVTADFLPPSFELQIDRAVFNLDRIRKTADKLEKWPEVAKVQYGQEWINRLQVFSKFMGTITLAGGVLLLFSAAFVVANTIKLTVYARQDELEIMRLVGATNGFIEAPFIIEAFIQGFVGSCLAVAVVFVSYRYLKDLVLASDLLRGISLIFLPWTYTVTIIVASVLLCVGGTAVAMRRFLRL